MNWKTKQEPSNWDILILLLAIIFGVAIGWQLYEWAEWFLLLGPYGNF